MATRSTIAVRHADNTVSQVYAHWDGYIEHNGRILQESYNSLELAEALVALGDISSLDHSIECPDSHSFKHSVDGYTVFYGRDRGEEGVEPRKFASVQDYVRNRQDEEYNYLWDMGQWKVISYATDNQWRPLAQAIADLA